MKKWSRGLTYMLCNEIAAPQYAAKRAACRNPFGWLRILIPIAGIVGIAALVQREDHKMRWTALKKRRKALNL